MRLALVLLGRATMRAALPRLIDRRGCGTVERARVTTAATDPTTRHARARERLLAQYAAIPAGDPVRLAKHTSNLFRPRAKVSRPGLDVSDLDRVLGVDQDARTADVQGMTMAEGRIYFSRANGNLYRITFANGAPVAGTEQLVDSSVDWHSRGLFLRG